MIAFLKIYGDVIWLWNPKYCMLHFFHHQSVRLKMADWSCSTSCCLGLLIAQWGVLKLYNFLLDTCWIRGKAGNLGPKIPIVLSPLCQVAEKVGHIQNRSWQCDARLPDRLWSQQLCNWVSIYRIKVLTHTALPAFKNDASPGSRSTLHRSHVFSLSAAFHCQLRNSSEKIQLPF